MLLLFSWWLGRKTKKLEDEGNQESTAREQGIKRSHLFARMPADGHLAASTHARHRGPIGRQTFWPQVTR